MATIIADEAQVELIKRGVQNAVDERTLIINQCDSLITSLQSQLAETQAKRDTAQAELDSIAGISSQLV